MLDFFSFRFGHNAKIVHFLGPVKPWSSSSQKDGSYSDTMEQFVCMWWKEYLGHTTTSGPEKEPSEEWVETQQVPASMRSGKSHCDWLHGQSEEQYNKRQATSENNKGSVLRLQACYGTSLRHGMFFNLTCH